MRQINFRGKALYTDEKFHKYDWVYGGIYDGSDFGKVFIVNYLEGLVEVDPETVGQFTGLYDKNGREIYERDVIICNIPHSGATLPHSGEVVFEIAHASFATKNEGGKTLFHNHMVNTRAIIGNKFDNPELLQL